MKHTIENLWNGNIAPAESCGIGAPEIENLIRLMERNREVLHNGLSDQQKSQLEKYTDCAEEYTFLITAQAFRDGFCLASKLLTEALL